MNESAQPRLDEPLDFEGHAAALNIPVEDVLEALRWASGTVLAREYQFSALEVDAICEMRGWRAWGDRPDARESAPDVVRQLELRRLMRGPAVPTASDALAGLADGANEGARALARDLMMPTWTRPPLAKAPRGRTYRQTVVRRKGPQLPPSIWWSRGGYHSSDVRTWVDRGHESGCPVERLIVCLLRQEMERQRKCVESAHAKGKRVCATPWQRVFPLAAIAMVLYYESRKTTRTGYAACVAGIPRGQIAKLSAHKSRGSDLVPDTISINLRRLRHLLAGVLEYHQPNPDEAHRLDLPHAVHYLEDGRQVFQAANVYWLRDAAWCIENARRLGFDFSSVRVDQSTGYGGLPIFQILTPLLQPPVPELKSLPASEAHPEPEGSSCGPTGRGQPSPRGQPP